MKKIINILASILLVMSLSAIASEESKKQVTTSFGMQAVFTAQEGKGEELAQILAKASGVVASLDGSILYLVQIGAVDTDKVLITEVWESQEAHRASLTNIQVRALISIAKPLIADIQHIPVKPLAGIEL